MRGQIDEVSFLAEMPEAERTTGGNRELTAMLGLLDSMSEQQACDLFSRLAKREHVARAIAEQVAMAIASRGGLTAALDALATLRMSPAYSEFCDRHRTIVRHLDLVKDPSRIAERFDQCEGEQLAGVTHQQLHHHLVVLLGLRIVERARAGNLRPAALAAIRKLIENQSSPVADLVIAVWEV